MADDLLTLPATAPAGDAFRLLWSLGIDVPFPTDSTQPAGDWLRSLELTPAQWKLIHHRAQEATHHE
ncbi:hypothetical protein [Halomonas sp. BM-2019]|uniref:hypothetical protein n=1 Tax=Halomonas sp. BM-2019 TaxID=2811227 RepID=UPI001B3C3513|nr:MAG: hypothetical protein J5F18_14845 [Halomonas sp. BM-2019]